MALPREWKRASESAVNRSWQPHCRLNRHAGAKGLTVTVLETKDLATTYEVKWA